MTAPLSPLAERAERERTEILAALRSCRGDVRATAKRLGVPERTLWRRLAAHGLRAELPEIRAWRPRAAVRPRVANQFVALVGDAPVTLTDAPADPQPKEEG